MLGLSPHMDGGTVERWIDGGYQRVYKSVFAGALRRFDPFDATHRLKTREIPSPAVCSMFRTYQVWTALSRQGPGDGTLQLVPIADAICNVLLRELQDDVAEDDLCGANSGRASGISAEWHSELTAAVVSIREVASGGTICKEGTWKEILVQDSSCTPVELAASRIDFDAWFKKLPRLKRRIASTLAAGETINETAKRLKLMPGRISQLRRELADNWRAYHGESAVAAAVC